MGTGLDHDTACDMGVCKRWRFTHQISADDYVLRL